MTLPANWKIATYESADAEPGFEAVAVTLQSRQHKGKTIWSFQPVVVFDSDPTVARGRLVAFLEAEIAKEASRREQAAKLGEMASERAAVRRAAKAVA